MSLEYKVLGQPGRDNALFVEVNRGQALERFLFDCGAGCLDALELHQVLGTDHLCFSHLHMDHIGGFDGFFRANFDRKQPNVVWGPPETARILQHRFLGYMWNIPSSSEAVWRVNEVYPEHIQTYRFEVREAFEVMHHEGRREHSGVLIENTSYTLEVQTLDHQTPSLAYMLREKVQQNIDAEGLTALGLPPGPWLKQLKDAGFNQETIEVEGQSYGVAELRARLLVDSAADSVAYLTDFLLNEVTMERLVRWLKGCQTMVCESQYRHSDIELAQKNFHTTNVLVAELAKRAEVGELVLFHLSDRYNTVEWKRLLAEAQVVFPEARFPLDWNSVILK